MVKNTADIIPINQNELPPKRVARAQPEKHPDDATRKKNTIKTQNKAVLKSAFDLAKRIKSSTIFVYGDAIDETHFPEKLPAGIDIILVTKNDNYTYHGNHQFNKIITVPKLKLGRMGLVKIAVVLALSNKMVKPEDKIVFIAGKADMSMLDTVICFCIDNESELLTGHSIAEIPDTISPGVFEQTLNLAIELGNKGKEGKAVGTIFVLGDEEKVMQLSRQMIINPFKGYEPEERNILNPALKETLRELSSVDGAFVVAGNGEIIAAGRYLGAAMEDAEIPRGLGSRHMAAAGITALTNAIAIVISESTGDVRIFRSGKIIMAIEKPTHK